MSHVGLGVRFAPMELADIPQVAAIDRLSFPQPWSEQSYRFELVDNRNAHFIVALAPNPNGARGLWKQLWGGWPARRVVGYAGFWFVVDEAHINTIAVHPEWRRRGIGERLLVKLLAQARGLGAATATLEVRVSNLAAQQLYQKYRFEEVGRRPHYYRDGEDALLMTIRLNAPTSEASVNKE
jgi:ribosomal-protein-alanine N-acetyltransferase